MTDRRRIAGRGALARLAAALALALAAPAAGQGIDHWSPEIAEASARFGVPQEWIRRVMQAESGGHVMLDGRPVTSRAGAMGLMQLMPGTWAEMRRLHGLGRDPYAPRDNLLAGAAYLRTMYDRFGYPGLFAAYNAGPGRYARHLATGAALPAETVAYLRKVSGAGAALDAGVAGSTSGIQTLEAVGRRALRPRSLFIVNRDSPDARAGEGVLSASAGLFAIQADPSRCRTQAGTEVSRMLKTGCASPPKWRVQTSHSACAFACGLTAVKQTTGAESRNRP